MATVVIAGRSYEIAPYKLGALKQAAPHIDAINAAQGSLSTMAGMVDSAVHLIGVLAPGLAKLDPALTPAALEDLIDIGDLQAITAAVTELLRESGLAPKGEATVPTEPETVGASTTNSEALSAS
jgi:hypothetical protein